MKSFHTQMLRGNRLTNDNICINGQSCLDKLRPLPFYVDFPLLPSAFYFYSLPHSSTLFPSPPLLSPLKTSLDWTMWLEAKHKKKNQKTCVLFILSPLLTLMREKPSQSILFYLHLSLCLHTLQISFLLSFPPSFRFFFLLLPLSFLHTEHENHLITRGGTENVGRGEGWFN